jgi:hypothetical protein
VQRVLVAAERSGATVVVPKPGQRIDLLDPPELEDWWTAVGSADDQPGHVSDAGLGSAVLAKTVSRLLAFLPD